MPLKVQACATIFTCWDVLPLGPRSVVAVVAEELVVVVAVFMTVVAGVSVVVVVVGVEVGNLSLVVGVAVVLGLLLLFPRNVLL